jgi:uncharacterized phage protein gp47/JayE
VLLEPKTYEELMEEALRLIPRNTPITNLSPGAIARTLLEVMNKELATYYERLTVADSMGFLSTATGSRVDLIGRMLDCYRWPNESDENYKYRISKQVTAAAAANKTAIRLAVLAVDGVKDVHMVPWVLGTGSFAVYIIGENPNVSDEVLEKAQAAIDEVQAYGNKGIAVRPKEVPIELKIRLTFKGDVSEDRKRSLALEARREVRKYLQNLSIGDEIIINEIVKRVMSVSSDIKNMSIYHFYLRDEPVLIQDQKLNWDERLVEADVPNAIYVS